MSNISNNIQKNNTGNSNVKPNEMQGVYFSSSVKIIDPNTGEVLVNIRGD